MRVSPSGNNSVQSTETSSAKQTGRAAGTHNAKKTQGETETSSARSTEGTNATISDRGRELAQAKHVASSAPDVREAKIQELRERIAAGKYNVDHEKVADRMVDEHLKMSGIG